MTTKDERRVAVLGLLDLHAQVRWHEPGNDIAFADAVLELAGRLGRVDEVPAMRPVRVASPAAQKAAYKTASEAIAAAKERRERHVPLMTSRTAQIDAGGAEHG